jgi:hypothetical protein
MKKGMCLLLVLVGFLLLTLAINAETSVTGKAVSQKSNVSIFIAPSLPVINIILPENKTYITNISLFLNYSTILADNVWYNFNTAPNNSITSNIRYDIGEGSNTLYMYANNSFGASAKNITFTVNTTLLKILYEHYKSPYGASSHDFIYEAYEDLQNLRDVCLEDIRYGKICFLQPINLVNDANISDRLVDLDTHANISFDKAGLNSAALPNFNRPAIIWLYNLSFINPVVLRDGVLCPTSICRIESYINGTLKFNVTSFSYYSAEEYSAEKAARAAAAGIICASYWNCTEWSTCINNMQNRSCIQTNPYCLPIGLKPVESKACKEEYPLYTPPAEEKPSIIQIVFAQKECCLFGLCLFRFIFCWYWWVLIAIIALWLIRITGKTAKYKKRKIRRS